MTGALFAYTRRGLETARRCAAALPETGWELYAPRRLAGEDGVLPLGSPAQEDYERLFREKRVLIFAGACGIAVRAVGPFLRDKLTDPAVLCTGEEGRFVIPLLSGHVGGANALAERLASALGAQAVITTATEGRGRFSPDRWAAERGYAVSGRDAAKRVSAALLEGDVPLCCSLPHRGELPPGTFFGSRGPLGIYIGWETRSPFACTLRLIPRTLRLGLGCRRGKPGEAILEAVAGVLDRAGLDSRAVRTAATIDLKRDEPGLADCCAALGCGLEFYSAEELRAVPGEFTGSAFVEAAAGVDNVCERAAMVRGERLLVRKYAQDGVTVAVAAEKTEVCF